MNIIKYNPLFTGKPLNNFLDDFFNNSLSDIAGSDFTYSRPSVNIKESDAAYLLELAAPGLRREDFNIEIDKDHLMISASREEEKNTTEGKYTRNEFNYNSFKRRFYLPDTINVEDIAARYEDGILYLDLPKKEEARPKAPLSIEIK